MNIIFAVLFVVFGLSLLELIELRPPAFLQSAAGKGRQNSGTLGVFVLGLTFVVSAFTCTAPFIGTVLVAASTASTGAAWIRPIAGMASFAAALALPFFLLALFPSLLARLPKSGAWLSTVKGAMGFLGTGRRAQVFIERRSGMAVETPDAASRAWPVGSDCLCRCGMASRCVAPRFFYTGQPGDTGPPRLGRSLRVSGGVLRLRLIGSPDSAAHGRLASSAGLWGSDACE